jgi:hypothetical protein
VSIEYLLTFKWQSGSGVITQTETVVGDVDTRVDLYIPAGAANKPAAFGLVLSKALAVFLVCDQAVTLKSGGTDAVQTVTVTGGPTGGSFTLTFAGQTTAAIPYNATAAQVQTALTALAAIGAGGVAVTGGPLPGTPVVVGFRTLNSVQAVALMTHADALTGGTAPAVAVATTTAGVAPDTTVALKAGVTYPWRTAGYSPLLFAADVSTLRVTNAGAAPANLKVRALSVA